MKRPIELPVVETVAGHGDHAETRTTHPAFGMIGASRVSGGHTNLYGSDFQHNAYMTIRIRRSELRRDLSRDWHYGRDELIEVALSEAQWATFVSAPNVGEGVPCTLQHINFDLVPGIPDPIVRHEQFGDEMVKTLEAVNARIQSVIEKIDDMGLPNRKADSLKQELHVAASHLKSNVKFVARQFDEHMEGTVEKAKAEIHGYMTGVIMRAGVDSLGAPAPLQIESDDSLPAPPEPSP